MRVDTAPRPAAPEPAQRPRSVVVQGVDWRLRRDVLSLKWILDQYRGRSRGVDRWVPIFAAASRDDMIGHMTKRRMVSQADRKRLKDLPSYIGGSRR